MVQVHLEILKMSQVYNWFHLFEVISCFWGRSDMNAFNLVHPKSYLVGGFNPIKKILLTLPETNIAPENRPSQKEIHIPTIHFLGLC